MLTSQELAGLKINVMAPWKLPIQIYLGILLLLPFVLPAQTYTDADRIRMRREAEETVKYYFFGLNQLGDASERAKQWREDDINNMLANYFESSNVPIYNDLIRNNRDSSFLSAREYLENVDKLYQKGVDFEYNLNLKNPCFQRIGDENFYLVKIEVAKNQKVSSIPIMLPISTGTRWIFM
ncbi:MAG: hypothetical protein HC880_20880 [Bacteroidia bacterium]|nr:hypothetical protein [Bacteroidia bacterium]